MRVAFRVDSSSRMGSGHLMRCLVLANRIRQRGGETMFLCADLPGNVASLVSQAGHGLQLLSGAYRPSSPDPFAVQAARDAEECMRELRRRGSWDWIVSDHYGIEATWEAALGATARILVIDDIANRPHRCDVLLDQNYYEDTAHRYTSLVPSACRLLLGPRFALLDPDFLQVRGRMRPRDGAVRRVLIFFGGMDERNHTLLALKAALKTAPHVDVDVVAGRSNPHLAAVEELCRSSARARLHIQTRRMAALMEGADLSLGAGGVAAWERCAVRLPSLVTIVAGNQEQSMRDLAKAGAIWLAGTAEEVGLDVYCQGLDKALREPEALREMAAKAGAIMDGCETGLDTCLATMRDPA